MSPSKLRKLEKMRLRKINKNTIFTEITTKLPITEVITEKELLKKSGVITLFALVALTIFWFLFSLQSVFAYSREKINLLDRLKGDLL